MEEFAQSIEKGEYKNNGDGVYRPIVITSTASLKKELSKKFKSRQFGSSAHVDNNNPLLFLEIEHKETISLLEQCQKMKL